MADVRDPVATLLDRDEHREDMLRNLGRGLNNLADVAEEYKVAWKAAVGVGWVKGDLVKAGFVDPSKLPRVAGASRERVTLAAPDRGDTEVESK